MVTLFLSHFGPSDPLALTLLLTIIVTMVVILMIQWCSLRKLGHIAWYTNPYPWFHSVRWMPGCRVGLRRSAPTYGKRQRIRGASQRCAIQIHVLYFFM